MKLDGLKVLSLCQVDDAMVMERPRMEGHAASLPDCALINYCKYLITELSNHNDLTLQTIDFSTDKLGFKAISACAVIATAQSQDTTWRSTRYGWQWSRKHD